MSISKLLDKGYSIINMKVSCDLCAESIDNALHQMLEYTTLDELFKHRLELVVGGYNLSWYFFNVPHNTFFERYFNGDSPIVQYDPTLKDGFYLVNHYLGIVIYSSGA